MKKMKDIYPNVAFLRGEPRWFETINWDNKRKARYLYSFSEDSIYFFKTKQVATTALVAYAFLGHWTEKQKQQTNIEFFQDRYKASKCGWVICFDDGLNLLYFIKP